MLPKGLLEHIPVHDLHIVPARHLCRPRGSQFVVELDENEPAYGPNEVVSERAPSRSDLDDLVVRRGAQRGDDLPLQVGVDEEVLSQRAFGASRGRFANDVEP
jgi:hypothetical protein